MRATAEESPCFSHEQMLVALREFLWQSSLFLAEEEARVEARHEPGSGGRRHAQLVRKVNSATLSRANSRDRFSQVDMQASPCYSGRSAYCVIRGLTAGLRTCHNPFALEPA